jgi:hypothetical protein
MVLRAAERVVALDFDFVMGSSEVMRRHPPHHFSPAWGIPAGRDAKRVFATSNSASESILSKIIAL